MTVRRERAIEELYADDPERADALAFGRRAGATRRGFLGGARVAAMTAAVGAGIPLASRTPGDDRTHLLDYLSTAFPETAGGQRGFRNPFTL